MMWVPWVMVLGWSPGPHPQLMGYQPLWMLMSGRDLASSYWARLGVHEQGMRERED